MSAEGGVYLVLKFLHVLGAILFVGNIVVTGVWKALADRTGEVRVVAFAQRLVTVTDVAFTGTGAVLVLLTGLHMAAVGHERFWTLPWVMWGLVLFVLSGAIWGSVLVPIQIRQARLARSFGDAIPDEYRRLGRRWTVWGTIAALLPVVALWFMVSGPA